MTSSVPFASHVLRREEDTDMPAVQKEVAMERNTLGEY